MHKRILLLGTTGIEKESIARNLQQVLNKDYQHDCHIVDFEKEYLKKSTLFRNWSQFLTTSTNFQNRIWNDAWENFSRDLGIKFSKDIPIILLLHSTYIREDYGMRSVLELNNLCLDFQPSLIINLIGDIFNLWWKTEQRSQGILFKGQPTFEQLLLARRAEIYFGDLITCQKSLSHPARHIVCSVNHPIQVLINIILFDAKIVYLSFPISEPRRLGEAGDKNFIEEINELHIKAADSMSNNNSHVFISPLAIDELPFRSVAMEAIQNKDSKLSFNLDLRWSLLDLWGENKLLFRDLNPPKIVEVPIFQIKHIHGLIKTDVGWRDYKLVSQADVLAIYCPIPPGREEVTRGVMGEWQKAEEIGIPCYVLQKPEWDEKNKLNTYLGNPGSMGSQPMNSFSHRVEHLDELFSRCLSHN